ncbi:hypothetical protein FOZ60_006498 [Perkinsus olseni]|uniref:Uncharacterized protein n=1 Tax=Perkinsus olseni TaxID=32597 RepID=A0A7J6NR30_PEROL|nr:hypothetical protein FOZ60_006498 [Perkinsus olseni]
MVRLLLSLLIPPCAVLGSPRTKGSYPMGFHCPPRRDIFDFMDHKWRYSPSIKQPTQKDEDSRYNEITLWDDLRQWPAHNKLKLSADTREILLETPTRTYKFRWVNFVPRPHEEEPVMAMEGPREERSWGTPEEIEQGRKDFARLRDKQLIRSYHVSVVALLPTGLGFLLQRCISKIMIIAGNTCIGEGGLEVDDDRRSRFH